MGSQITNLTGVVQAAGADGTAAGETALQTKFGVVKFTAART